MFAVIASIYQLMRGGEILIAVGGRADQGLLRA